MTIDQVLTSLPDDMPAAFGREGALAHSRIVQAIARATQAPIDLRTRSIVAACFDEFVRADCRPRIALRATAELMEELGTTQQQLGLVRRELDAAFVQVHAIVMASMARFTRGRVVGESMLQLRRDVKHYLGGLHRQLCSAMAREEVRQERERAEQVALRGGSTRLGAPAVGRFRVVVAVGDELPNVVLEDPRLVPGRSSFEVLVPEGIDPADLEGALTGQVVVGPPSAGSEIEDSSVLVWQAASLLREGRTVDLRRLVPCSDLLGVLLVCGNAVMARLLADKHLVPLTNLTANRRRELASTLLAWLERGVAGNALAREIGVPPQTVHHRLKQLRDLFGSALDDPSQRLELIVALRASQPSWA